MAEQVKISQRCGWDFISNGVIFLQEIHRRFIPYRGEPIDPHFTGIAVNLIIFGFIKLNLVTVFKVSDVSPGGFTHLIALFGGYAQLWGALLKFHGVNAGVFACFNKIFGDTNIAIVINTYLGYDIGRMIIPHPFVPDFDFSSHRILL